MPYPKKSRPSHVADSAALFPILLEAANNIVRASIPTSLFPRPTLPLLFLGRDHRLEAMLLPSGQVDRRLFPLRHGLGDEYVLYARALSEESKIVSPAFLWCLASMPYPEPRTLLLQEAFPRMFSSPSHPYPFPGCCGLPASVHQW